MDRPIADYAMISDRHSAALVSIDGSVDWLCFPRFDSPSVFGRLLDPDAGYWSIGPVPPAGVTRAYVDDTMVLRTTFTAESGVVELTDALASGPGDDPHRLGATAPHALVREVRCIAGTMDVAVEFHPRPEYGLVRPVLAEKGAAFTASGGPSVLILSAPPGLEISGSAVRGRATLQAGQTARYAVRWAPLSAPGTTPWSQEDIGTALATTTESWRAWSQAHQNYDGPWPDLVRHSGRVLQALSYQPTGAIIAAATTSIPESVGGERNWDYRFTWIRDASLAMDALWVAACPDEASEFFAFLTAAAALQPGHQLQIMYGVGGEHDLTERELPHLSGWRGSRPVRIGNAAWTQPQLDIYGELLATASRFADQLDGADPAVRRFLTNLADAAAVAWRQPDHGIWEVRGPPRHFLHSKLMCWVALDRAVALADLLGAASHVEAWSDARNEIRAAILEHGWSPVANAYTQSFGSRDLDASALLLPISGFLPADDPRVLATIDAVADRLTDARGLLHRYRTDTGVDGLPGGEGTFLACTFWLAQALAMTGRVARAREVFDRAAARANDVGLLAEQSDPANGELLGNFPQAFSHIGLVNAAQAIADAS